GHGGHCGEAEYQLPARVELAPFSPLVLAVGLPAGECVNLRAAPGKKAELLTCLPGGTRLSLAPLAETHQAEGQEPYYLSRSLAWASESQWLRVRAPDGQEGWVDAKAGNVGWAP
ncbi:MAG TPA: SH3 domain-containing protein, partial [Anaerolineae bacterium]|nr:SH3 domain-containing protein [Anaerolineae bacterium]